MYRQLFSDTLFFYSYTIDLSTLLQKLIDIQIESRLAIFSNILSITKESTILETNLLTTFSIYSYLPDYQFSQHLRNLPFS